MNDEVENIVNHCLNPLIINKCYIQQVREEFTMLAYFLKSFKPHNLLEIGCKGGSFFMMNHFSTGTKIGVDIEDQFHMNMHFYTYQQDFSFIQGNSQTVETFNKVSEKCNSFDFIFIDGDHSYEGVKRDFELYKPLLSARGYIGFHDVDPDHVFKGDAGGGEVYMFWEELNYGSKTEIICKKSSATYSMWGIKEHYGGIGLWRP